jgi:hypothetical protein
VPEADEERDFPTMVSKPGAYSTASMFDDRPPGSPSVVPPPELSPVTEEESATLGGAPGDDEGDSATVVYQAGRAPWSQQTIEVPLEMRAQAGVSAQAEPDPLFEEVFDDAEPIPPPPPAYVAPTPAPPPPMAAPAEEPEEIIEEAEVEEAPQPWVPAHSTATAPPSMPASSSASFADLSPAPAAPEPAGPASQAAEVAVPPDMVEKIAQRVVAQISEKVVREVAWEVIPDLAEALIKREIERLKAELQRT